MIAYAKTQQDKNEKKLNYVIYIYIQKMYMSILKIFVSDKFNR